MVETDNAKSKREFKKLSKNMGERLDKDKGRSIEELQAPDFRPSQSTDKLRQRAEEKEKHLGRTGIKGMTFTFPVDPSTNKTPGATVVASSSASAPGNKRLHHHLRTNTPRDEFDESMEVINNAATGLVIDTNFNNPSDAALTPTSTYVTSSSANADPASTTVGDRIHHRGHHNSISSVTSQMSAFPLSPPSPEARMPRTVRTAKKPAQQQQQKDQAQQQQNILRFPSAFENDFTPIALLCPTPSVKQGNTYGEAIGFSGLANSTNHADVFGIARPTFEFALDELMNNAECNSDVETSTSGGWNNEDGSSNLTNSVSSLSIPTPVSAISMSSFSGLQITPVVAPPASASDSMQGVHSTGGGLATVHDEYDMDGQEMMDSDFMSCVTKSPAPPLNLPSKSAPASPAIFAMSPITCKSGGGDITDDVSLPAPLSLPKGSMLPGPSPTPSPAPAPSHHVIRRRYSTTNAPEGKKGGRQPSATAPRNARASYGNSAPGGVKSECANCGANSTPLWRRGLNDELNCNACGLFAKLHKRPRPKSLRGSTGEGGTRHPGWASKGGASDETGEPVSCYNCATIATPLWRKDEDGKTLCNALKLHGERRPSSMKSDVIRKRSRHDSRRGTSSSETPSASPGASRRTSPTPPPMSAVGPSRRDRGGADDITFSVPPNHGHSPNEQASMSPYAQAAHSFDYNTSSHGGGGGGGGGTGGTGGQDNSPVDLMSMSHAMSDNGVDPMLGGMTFSPGATYQETLQYPGPFSLSYFYGGMTPTPDTNNHGPAESNTQHQSQHQPQHQSQPQQPQPQPQQQQQHQQQQQKEQPAHRHAHSSAASQGSPEATHLNDTMFGPVANPTSAQIDTMSMWDQPFQVPMSTPYSFNYAGQVVQGTAAQQDQGLGFVHPPMLPPLPYWTADTGVATKAETDHEMSFGHH
ncbi:hypothetical protein FRB96_008581 [Tulasnella sp. 330]|nr:hypothetical protein FRB96_008581 [Tulasnella sp. 330]